MANHIIFTVYQNKAKLEKFHDRTLTAPEVDSINDKNYYCIKTQLIAQHVKFIECTGNYAGNHEQSFLISTNDEFFAAKYCEKYNQDCYLLVDSNNNAELIDQTRHTIQLGRWQQVVMAIAIAEIGYTVCKGQYYVCSHKLYPAPMLAGIL